MFHNARGLGCSSRRWSTPGDSEHGLEWIPNRRTANRPGARGRQRSLVRRTCAHRRDCRTRRARAHQFQHRLSETRTEFLAGRSRGVSRPSRARVAVSDGADDHRRTAGSLAGRHRQQRSGAVQVAGARRPLGCAGEATRRCNMRPAWRAYSGSICDRSASERVCGTSCQRGRSIGCRTDTRRTSTACSVCWPSTASGCSSTSSETSLGGGEICVADTSAGRAVCATNTGPR
jgi:hypothetical protein